MEVITQVINLMLNKGKDQTLEARQIGSLTLNSKISTIINQTVTTPLKEQSASHLGKTKIILICNEHCPQLLDLQTSPLQIALAIKTCTMGTNLL